jgi:hypothetical protein
MAGRLQPDLIQVRDKALGSWILPPVRNGGFELGNGAQTIDVLLDGVTIGSRPFDVLLEVIDRRVGGMSGRERRVKVRVGKGQERKHGFRLGNELLACYKTRIVSVGNPLAPLALAIFSHTGYRLPAAPITPLPIALL